MPKQMTYLSAIMKYMYLIPVSYTHLDVYKRQHTDALLLYISQSGGAMIATAWLPLIGKYIEAERLYVSSLVVNHLHPYTEWGYGVTTRAITLGFFAAFKNTKFNGIGLSLIHILL